ncbi:MAG TPA: transglycosylase SLT domain-containing protein, partial [Anaerolineaceae bacterium]|nr:transglycosylase SLT domain-containing protein [Anaerolineaceae bacterium]
MNRVQIAILPAVLLSSLLIILLTQWISNPQTVAHAFSGEKSADPSAQQEPALPASNGEAQAPAGSDSAGEPDQPVSCSLGSGFPESIRRWCDLIEPHAREHDLDPNLVAAVILQESGGKADAFSKSGAVGLMQVMPRDGIAATFQCINGPCFAARPSIEELSDPQYNVAYGTRMLAGLINKHGSIRE